MAAKHAHIIQISAFKYGDHIGLSMGNFKKSAVVIISKSVKCIRRQSRLLTFDVKLVRMRYDLPHTKKD